MGSEKMDTEIRREQIAETALNLVAAQGVKGLSIAAVARRVGLVPSGIYRHFKSKDEILEAILDLMEKRLLANVEAARQETTDPLERLRILMTLHIRFIRENRAIPRIVFSDDVHAGHPERKSRVKNILSGYLAGVTEFIRQGQHDGCIRPDLDPETLGLTFFGMIIPAGILWHLTDGGFDVTKHASRAWQIFLAAVAVPATAEQGTNV